MKRWDQCNDRTQNKIRCPRTQKCFGRETRWRWMWKQIDWVMYLSVFKYGTAHLDRLIRATRDRSLSLHFFVDQLMWKCSRFYRKNSLFRTHFLLSFFLSFFFFFWVTCSELQSSEGTAGMLQLWEMAKTRQVHTAGNLILKKGLNSWLDGHLV